MKECTEKITAGMMHIRIKHYRGTWYVIDATIRNGIRFYLLEHETYGDEAAALIVTEHGLAITETYDDIETGLDDFGY